MCPVLPRTILLCLAFAYSCLAQDCKGAPTYTTAQLEARDSAECALEQAPACQRIRPVLTDAIFVGTVLKIANSDGQIRLNGECAKTLLQTVTVRVIKNFVGKDSGVVTVHAGDINGFYFQTKRKYLIYGRRRDDGSLTVTSCGGTKKLDDAKEDLAYLASWEILPEKSTIFGTAWRLKDESQERTMVPMSLPLRRQQVFITGPVNATVRTDDSGYYRAEDLAPGKYEVSIDTPFVTWPSKSQSIEIAGRGCAQIDFRVDPFRK